MRNPGGPDNRKSHRWGGGYRGATNRRGAGCHCTDKSRYHRCGGQSTPPHGHIRRTWGEVYDQEMGRYILAPFDEEVRP